MKQLCGDICLSSSVYLSGPRASADILPGLRIAIELFRNWPVLRLSRGRLDKHDALSAFFGCPGAAADASKSLLEETSGQILVFSHNVLK